MNMRRHVVDGHPEWFVESLTVPLPACEGGTRPSLFGRHAGALGVWLANDSRWSLLYSARVPLFGTGELVKACLGRAPTLILVNLNGANRRTSATWSNGEFARDTERGTFVFFLSAAMQTPQRVDQARAGADLAWCDEAKQELGFKSAFRVCRTGDCPISTLSDNDWVLGSRRWTLCGYACGQSASCEEVEAWWTGPR